MAAQTDEVAALKRRIEELERAVAEHESGAVVEPHKETTLYVKHEAGAAVRAHLWVVSGPDGEELLKLRSSEELVPSSARESVQLGVQHTFTQVGTHRVRLAVSEDAAAALALESLYSVPMSSVPGVHSHENASDTNRTLAYKSFERELKG